MVFNKIIFICLLVLIIGGVIMSQILLSYTNDIVYSISVPMTIYANAFILAYILRKLGIR